MPTENPYTTPEAAVEMADDALYQPKFLSTSGRIGRLRYLAYGTSINLLLYLVMIPLVGTSALIGQAQQESMSSIGGIIVLLLYIVTIIFSVIFARRRLNDLDKTGWLLLLFLVPIVNVGLVIYLVFFGGSDRSNRFGPAPVVNPLGVKVLGMLLPIIFIVAYSQPSQSLPTRITFRELNS